ncbi:MAG: hypothetical protein ACJ8C4_21105 [Gemmataceae bacterium]
MSSTQFSQPVASPGPPDRYSPVSALAVGAFGISAIAVILIVGMAVAAKVAGKPAYQPMLLLPAIVGFCMSLTGLWSVRRSQGARSGQGFARAGLWLSGLGAACYASYLVTTEMAIRAQARDFIVQWMADIAKEPVEISFLGTVDPAVRRDMLKTDADGKKVADLAGIRDRFGVLIYQYRDSDLVRMIRHAGNEFEVTSRGNRGWDYQMGGLVVDQVMNVRTREGELGCLISVMAEDRADLGGRFWHVVFKRSGPLEHKWADYGRLLNDIQNDAHNFLRNWAFKINRDRWAEAAQETVPLSERNQLKEIKDDEKFKQMLRNLVRVEGAAPSPEDRKTYGETIVRYQGINLAPGTIQAQVGPPDPEWVDGKMQVTQMIELNVESSPVVAYITIELVGNELLEHLKSLRAQDWKQLSFRPGLENFDSLRDIDRFPEHTFQVTKIDVYPNAARLISRPMPGER